MPKYLKVIDAQRPIIQNYFSLVFIRGERVSARVSRSRWIWLCFIEVLFGQELLESLVITAPNSGCPEDPDPKGIFGEANQLNLHIPSGLFTNLFRDHLIQLMYYKFYLQYLFIVPVTASIYENEKAGIIDVSRARFRLRKELLYLVIPFRRVYLASALGVNVLADLMVYLVTSNISIAVIVGVVLEFTRRMLKL